MKLFNFTFLFMWVLIISQSTQMAYSQLYESPVYDSTIDKSELRIGVRYSSDYYYMGRADSAAAPYLSPSIGYYHKSGLSIRSSLSYLTASGEGRIDLYTLSGGYDYYGEKVAAGFSVSEYFFNDLSYAVQAEMSTYFNAYTGYDFSAFMLYVDASLGFSEGTDVFLGAEINRTFYAVKNKLRITPAVYINAGTQKYYSEYYNMRSTQTGTGKGKGGKQSVPIQDVQILESEKFQVLDYEADLQISYKIRNVRFFISTTWTFPVNPATIVTDTGANEEDLKNGFYWSSGVRLTLK
ncbi:hypothetical protein SanaruYs_37630 [Chryseotalea sanaruensis]|uniref:Uncharacterized protein n=1 Tax=Chryseotalea sanaruensis TaxID=2482724 RepID=A0A401UF37_9BACT|nr:hypothetical protein [Chryseotalea sanaruensis]GCC53518.1 hypothetical protein SanaruYs_37630 [Chryseotalea sanaruensis]